MGWVCYSSAGSHKVSDLGSSGSTFVGNKGETKPTATLMSFLEEDLDNRVTRPSLGEEVNLPVKNHL